jgi:hypothetical protein
MSQGTLGMNHYMSKDEPRMGRRRGEPKPDATIHVLGTFQLSVSAPRYALPLQAFALQISLRLCP